jgi:hypothetical protein
VKNLVAAGTGRLVYRRREVTIAEPRVVHTADVRHLLPAPVRLVLRLARVDDFLLVRRTGG